MLSIINQLTKIKYLFKYKMPEYVPPSLTRDQIKNIRKTAKQLAWGPIDPTSRIAYYRNMGYWTPKFDFDLVTDEETDILREKKFLLKKYKGWHFTVHVSSDIDINNIETDDFLIRFI